MAIDGHRTASRHDNRQWHEVEPLNDGGYACLDGEWDDEDRGLGLRWPGSFSARCEGAE